MTPDTSAAPRTIAPCSALPDPIAVARAGLEWFVDDDFGFLEAQPREYDEAYLIKYLGYAETDLGKKISEFRVAFVDRHWKGPLIDFGCAAAQFIALRGGARTKGYDIIDRVAAALTKLGGWRDPWTWPRPEAISCWDSLEHLRRPDMLINRVTRWAFVSVPIFRDAKHARTSKHFRPDEHYWYWTRNSVTEFFRRLGFALREVSFGESALGREDIETFAFERIAE